MYDTRITLLREAAINRCLREPKGLTFRDIMTEVSKYLESNNVDTSVSKSTTYRDMDSIQKRYNVVIDHVKDEETKKTIYRYKEPLFSIYNAKLNLYFSILSICIFVYFVYFSNPHIVPDYRFPKTNTTTTKTERGKAP